MQEVVSNSTGFSTSGLSDSESEQSSQAGFGESSGSDDDKKPFSFGKARLKDKNQQGVEDNSKGSSVWSRLRDTVLSATKGPPNAGSTGEAGNEDGPGTTEWVTRMLTSDVVRSQNKKGCQAILFLLEEFMPDQVLSLSGGDRVKLMNRISMQIQYATQQLGLLVNEHIKNNTEELEAERKKNVELEGKLLKMNQTYLKEITTNRDKFRDPNGTVAKAVGSADQNGVIEFYEPLQYLSADMRAAVTAIVDEKVKTLFKHNPEQVKSLDAEKMSKFESMMQSDKLESMERMNSKLREQNRESLAKLNKAERSLEKVEWELSEAKRHSHTVERELASYQAAKAAELSRAMSTATKDIQASLAARRISKIAPQTADSQAEPKLAVPSSSPQRRATHYYTGGADTHHSDVGSGSLRSTQFYAGGAEMILVEPIRATPEPDESEGQETKACAACGNPCLPEALFCSQCGHKLGDCSPAAPSSAKEEEDGRRRTIVFDDDLNLDEETPVLVHSSLPESDPPAPTPPKEPGKLREAATEAKSPPLTSPAESETWSGKRSFASAVVSAMQKVATKGGSKRLSKDKGTSEALPGAIRWNDDEEQSAPKTARKPKKPQKPLAQAKVQRRTHSSLTGSRCSSMDSAASCSEAASAPFSDTEEAEKPPKPLNTQELQESEAVSAPLLPTLQTGIVSADPPPPKSPKQQESEVTGEGSENDDARRRSRMRTYVLESDLQKTRQQLEATLKELEECRALLATAESRIEMLEYQELMTSRTCCGLEASMTDSTKKLEKEVEQTQRLREQLEQVCGVLASAEERRLVVLAMCEENTLPKGCQTFVFSVRSRLLDGGSATEELEKVKKLLHDCPVDDSQSSPTSKDSRQGKKRDSVSQHRSMLQPALSHRAASLEEIKRNQELEQLVEKNKMFQDKVAVKTAQAESVLKENQVLKLALQDMQEELNTLTNDLRKATNSQEVAPASLESEMDRLERMEKMVDEGKVGVHMRLHQEAKLRDVAALSKRRSREEAQVPAVPKHWETSSRPSSVEDRRDKVFSPDLAPVPRRGSPVNKPMPPPSSPKASAGSPKAGPGVSPKVSQPLQPLVTSSFPSKARKGSDEGGKEEMKKALPFTRSSLGDVDMPDMLRTALADEPTSNKSPARSRGSIGGNMKPVFSGRRAETLMQGGLEKPLPAVNLKAETKERGSVLIGANGGMALLGNAAKKSASPAQ